jgi:hypothetical protein
MKKLVIFGIAILILLVGGVFLLSPHSKIENQTEPSKANTYEYYWGNGCPHCENVAKFFDSWDKKDKVTIDKKEVFGNQTNQILLAKRAQTCSINQNEIGVPFLYTPDGKCLTGDQPIIEYFQNLNP